MFDIYERKLVTEHFRWFIVDSLVISLWTSLSRGCQTVIGWVWTSCISFLSHMPANKHRLILVFVFFPFVSSTLQHMSRPLFLSLSLSGPTASLSPVWQFRTLSILVLAVSASQSGGRVSHLRGDGCCGLQLHSSFYCPSFSASVFWHFAPLFFLSSPVRRFLIFSFFPLVLQVECNLQQIWWSPKIREHDLILRLRSVLLLRFIVFKLFNWSPSLFMWCSCGSFNLLQLSTRYKEHCCWSEVTQK